MARADKGEWYRLSVVPGLDPRERTSRGVHDRNYFRLITFGWSIVYDGSILVGVIMCVRIGAHHAFSDEVWKSPETAISRISREVLCLDSNSF